MQLNPTEEVIALDAFKLDLPPICQVSDGSSQSGFLKQNRSQPPQQQELGPFDIISGRGRAASNNAGNQRFRQFISRNAHQYIDAPTSVEKTQVIISLVRILQEKLGARFFKQTATGYEPLGKKEIHEKVGHTLRDERKKAKSNVMSSTICNKEHVSERQSSRMESGGVDDEMTLNYPAPYHSKSDSQHEMNLIQFLASSKHETVPEPETTEFADLEPLPLPIPSDTCSRNKALPEPATRDPNLMASDNNGLFLDKLDNFLDFVDDLDELDLAGHHDEVPIC